MKGKVPLRFPRTSVDQLAGQMAKPVNPWFWMGMPVKLKRHKWVLDKRKWKSGNF